MQRFKCTNVVINPHTSAERGLQDIVCTASGTGMQDPAEELIIVKNPSSIWKSYLTLIVVRFSNSAQVIILRP